MSRRLTRISLALVLLLSSEVWAIGLGDINLDSALNEPLRAEIELLSATPEELANLNVELASAETFSRYGIDRPFYLQGIEFALSQAAEWPDRRSPFTGAHYRTFPDFPRRSIVVEWPPAARVHGPARSPNVCAAGRATGTGCRSAASCCPDGQRTHRAASTSAATAAARACNATAFAATRNTAADARAGAGT